MANVQNRKQNVSTLITGKDQHSPLRKADKKKYDRGDPLKLMRNSKIAVRKIKEMELLDQNQFMLEKLLEVKSNYNVIRWENQRKSLEESMDKGRFTKYPHIFKVSEIINKQKREKIQMRQDYEALSFSSKGGKGSLLGRSQIGFTNGSKLRNSNLYNSIDVQNMTYGGEQGRSNFFNNSNLADSSQQHIPTLMKNGSALVNKEQDPKVAALT